METYTREDFLRSHTNYVGRFTEPDMVKTANTLAVVIQDLETAADTLNAHAHRFDSKTGNVSNGYRSLVKVSLVLRYRCMEALDLGQEEDSTTKIRNWVSAVTCYTKVLVLADKIHKICPDNLYPTQDADLIAKYRELSAEVTDLDLSPLYGEALSFHFEDSCRNALYPLAVSFASMGDIYGGSVASKLKRLKDSGYCWEYMTDSKALGEQIVHTSRHQQVHFVKSFFNVTENRFVAKMRFLPSISTSYLHRLYFEDRTIEKLDGTRISVPKPSSHISQNYVPVRLVSSFRTRQMLGSCTNCSVFCRCSVRGDPSPYIIFHVHGGGFVSQTSQSHEDYLRQWSTKLNVPILSVDYSLAPEAPYPRALEEVLYSYCWMVENPLLLGTTAHKIIVVGDSAGGNFSAGLTLKCLELGIRVPDSLVLSYANLICQFSPSPSRLLTLIDPLLMFGSLIRCMNAYQDPSYLTSLPRTFQDELTALNFTRDIYLSPFLADKELLARFPDTLLISSDMDPCLDEAIEFSNKLLDAGVAVDLEVMSGLPHGFLSFAPLSTRCQRGLDKVTNLIKEKINRL